LTNKKQIFRLTLMRLFNYKNIFRSSFFRSKIFLLIIGATIICIFTAVTFFSTKNRLTITNKADESVDLSASPTNGKEYSTGRFIVQFETKINDNPNARFNSVNKEDFKSQISSEKIADLLISTNVNSIKPLLNASSSNKKPDLNQDNEYKTLINNLSNTYVVFVDQDVPIENIVNYFNSQNQVVYAQPDYIYATDAVSKPTVGTLNDPYFLDPAVMAKERSIDVKEGGWNPMTDNKALPYQWNLQKIKADKIIGQASGSNKVTVAVIDTGIYFDHPELIGRIWNNLGETGKDNDGNDKKSNDKDDDNNGYIDDWRGWDETEYYYDCYWNHCEKYKGPDNDPSDDSTEPYFSAFGLPNAIGGGHGTSVSGIIAATKNNKIGIAGIAKNVDIMPLRGLTAEGTGSSSQLAQMIFYATNNGADVINMSWGSLNESSIIRSAVKYADFHNVVLIASAGNSSREEKVYPAAFEEVIAVSATDENNKITSYSTFGNHISVSAPGGYGDNSILSLRGNGTDFACLSDYYCRSGYGRHTTNVMGLDLKYYHGNGTSFSAPQVAAEAALILAKNASLTKDQVQSIIKYSAADLGDKGKDKYFGYGLIDVNTAVNEMSTDPPPVAIISNPLSLDDIYTGRITIKGTASSQKALKYRLEFSPETGNNWSEDGITIISSSKQAVNNVSLGVWDTKNLEGTYILRLTVTDSDQRSRSSEVLVQLVNQSETKGWPISFESYRMINPLITKLGNLKENIVVTGNINGVYAYSSTGKLIKKWELPFVNGLAAGNIIKDSTGNEIVASTTNGIYILKINGSQTTVTTDKTYIFEGNLADVNGDGVHEIIATKFVGYPDYTHDVYALDSNGKPVGGFPINIHYGSYEYPDPNISRVRVGDVDSDGKEEVLVYLASASTQENSLLLLLSGGEKGVIKWSKTLSKGWGQTNPLLGFFDYDHDGNYDVYFSNRGHDSEASQIDILKGSDGTPLIPSYSYVGFNPHLVVPIDINSDGLTQLLVTSYDKPNEITILEFNKPNKMINVKNIKDSIASAQLYGINSNNKLEYFSFSEVYMLPPSEWPQISNSFISLFTADPKTFEASAYPNWPKSILADIWGAGGGYTYHGVMSNGGFPKNTQLYVQYCNRTTGVCKLHNLNIEQIPNIQKGQYLNDERHTGAFSTSKRNIRPTVAPSPTVGKKIKPTTSIFLKKISPTADY